MKFSYLSLASSTALALIYLLPTAPVKAQANWLGQAPANTYSFYSNKAPANTAGCQVSYTPGRATVGQAPSVQIESTFFSYDRDCTAFNASSAVVQSSISRLGAQRVASMISRRISRLGQGGAIRGQTADLSNGAHFEYDTPRTGDAAGNGTGKGVGAWTSFNYTNVEDTSAAAGMSGNIYTGALGADWSPASGKILLGAALTIDISNLETKFNDGNIDSLGIGITPYMSAAINDMIRVNALAGYTHTSNDADRMFTGTKITGKYNTNRFYAGIGVEASKTVKRIAISGSLGTLYGKEYVKGYRESAGGGDVAKTSNETSTLNAGMRFGYPIASGKNVMEPYMSYNFAYDYVMTKIKSGPTQPAHPNGKIGHNLGAGLSFQMGEKISGSLDYETELGRQKFSSHSGGVTFRMDF